MQPLRQATVHANGTATIPLTKGASVLVDVAVADWLTQWNWMHNKQGPRRESARHVNLAMARALAEHFGEEIEGCAVAFINGDHFDCRRSNLQIVVRGQRALRPVRVNGELATVTLTRGREAEVDAEDAEWLGRHNWSASVVVNYVKAMRGERNPDGSFKYVGLGREIWEHHYGPIPADKELEHIDGNPLRNCKSNMRLATRGENARNVKCHKDTASGLKGAYRGHCKSKPWRSAIMADGQNVTLGNFKTADEAHQAYCKASAELHGEYGCTRR